MAIAEHERGVGDLACIGECASTLIPGRIGLLELPDQLDDLRLERAGVADELLRFVCPEVAIGMQNNKAVVNYKHCKEIGRASCRERV